LPGNDRKPAPFRWPRPTRRGFVWLCAALTAVLVSVIFPVATTAQLPCPDLTWVAVPTAGGIHNLFDIHGISNQSVYVVGAEGTLLHFDGSHWNAVDTGISLDLWAVWAESDDDIWAVSSQHGITDGVFHFDGTDWTRLEGSPRGGDIIVSGPAVYVALVNRVYRLENDIWSYFELICGPGTCQNIRALAPKPGGGYFGAGLWGWDGVGIFKTWWNDQSFHGGESGIYMNVWVGPDAVYLVETSGELFTTDGNSSEVILSPQPESPIKRLTGGLFPVGITQDRRIAWFDGAAWQYSTSTLNDEIPTVASNWVWAASRDSVFGLGTSSVYLYDGATFHQEGFDPGPVGLDVADAWIDETNALWLAAGERIYRYSGIQWRNLVESGGDITAIWGGSLSRVFAVSDGGEVLEFDGSAWTTTLLSSRWQDVTGGNSGDVYIVGDYPVGAIMRYDGSAWLPYGSPDEPCTAAEVAYHTNGAEILLVGASNGDVFHYDNDVQTRIPDVFGQGRAIAVTDLWQTDGVVFAAGAEPYVARIDARGAAPLGVDAVPVPLNAIWGTAADRVWGAGTDGFVYFFDGSDWRFDGAASPSSEPLNSIVGAGPCNVYAAGDDGVVVSLKLRGAVANIDVAPLLDPFVIIPGDSVCGRVTVSSGRRTVGVSYNVTGASSDSGFIYTDPLGEAMACYTPARPGIDTVTVKVETGPLPRLSDTTFLTTVAAGLEHDPAGSPGDGETVYVHPGTVIEVSVLVEEAREGVVVDFAVSGANNDAGSDTSGVGGKVSHLYAVDAFGVDTVMASITHTFPGDTVTVALPIVLNLPPARLSFDESYHTHVETFVVSPGDTLCAYLLLEPPTQGVGAIVAISGANPQADTVLTDAAGEAGWCYRVSTWGVDTLTVRSPGVAGIDTLIRNLVPPEVALSNVDGKVHWNLIPGETICTYATLSQPAPGSEVAFRVRGANHRDESVPVDAEGRALWCYAPFRLGVDTVTAGFGIPGLLSADTMSYTMRHPALEFDRGLYTGLETVLGVPGSKLSARFLFDRAVSDQRVDLDVRGATTATDSATTSGWIVTLYYQTAAAGADTLTAVSVFDFSDTLYHSSASMVFEVYTPQFAIDGGYHTLPETLLTSQDFVACAVFAVTPSIPGVDVVCNVRGANAAVVNAKSDANGSVLVCYPAPSEGADTLSATAHFEIKGAAWETTAVLVAEVRSGDGVLPLVSMEVDPKGVDSYALMLEFDSDQQLFDPNAVLYLEGVNGSATSHPVSLDQLPNGGWTYGAEFLVFYDGRLEVVAQSLDMVGNIMYLERAWDVGRFVRGTAVAFRSVDDMIRIDAETIRLNRSGALSISRGGFTGESPVDVSGQPLVAVSDRFEIRTSARFLGRPDLTLRHSYRVGGIPNPENDERKVGIYRREGDHWVYAGGQGSDGRVIATVDLSGEYAAMFNASYDVRPAETVLHQNYPNPFNPATTIAYEVHRDGPVELTVYEVTGVRVATLVNTNRPSGVHEVKWNGRDQAGNPVASGVYFYRLVAEGATRTRKMVLLR